MSPQDGESWDPGLKFSSHPQVCVTLRAIQPGPNPERVPRKLQTTPSECSAAVSEPLAPPPGTLTVL